MLFTSSSERGSGTISAPSCPPSSAAVSSRRSRLLTSCSCRRAFLRAVIESVPVTTCLGQYAFPSHQRASSLLTGRNCQFLPVRARERHTRPRLHSDLACRRAAGSGTHSSTGKATAGQTSMKAGQRRKDHSGHTGRDPRLVLHRRDLGKPKLQGGG